MVVSEQKSEYMVAGACSDCGARVQQRTACVDVVTHSAVELCEACWQAYRQRQAFAAGCCG